jgi:hypothetical protein
MSAAELVLFRVLELRTASDVTVILIPDGAVAVAVVDVLVLSTKSSVARGEMIRVSEPSF